MTKKQRQQKTKFKAAIFDLDGVITKTEKLHCAAWERTFNDFLRTLHKDFQKPFDKEEYVKYVDGKPRYEGVEAFLRSRGIELPYGNPSDEPGFYSVCAIGNQKNKEFQRILETKGADVIHTSIDFIRKLKEKGYKIGVASSSKNCQLVLERAGIEKIFDTKVDGIISEKLKLAGKPEPDIFIKAAEWLNVKPSECMIVEDAIAGVQAGKKGNFGLVLGIARTYLASAPLLEEGADMVVTDLSEISVEDVEAWFEYKIEQQSWLYTYHGFKKSEEKLRETLMTIGNGYLGTRGCFEGENASLFHYPGTYIAGIYNKLPTKIANKLIYNNDFVNCPNWLCLDFKLDTGKYQSLLKQRILSYKQTLNMKEGYMERIIVVEDDLRRITRIHSKRFASMADPHICAISYEITPVNYSARMFVRSGLDGNIINAGVYRYKDLASQHLEGIESGTTNYGIFLHVQTNASKRQIVYHSKLDIYEDGKKIESEKKIIEQTPSRIFEEMEVYAKENSVYRVEKIVAIYTSLDYDVKDPFLAGKKALMKVENYNTLFYPHLQVWESIWNRADIIIDGDRFVQNVLRLHMYHLLISASEHNEKIDAGMTARGLHGEAYRGHVFWDEVYIFPFYLMRFPEIVRALLMYRYRRLDGAREYARQNNYEGAMYPWQTADGAEEETQEIHFNPKSNRWDVDLSRRQRHVNIAIFYNIVRYIEATNDIEFLNNYGAEMMIEIARFWASISKFDEKTGKYHIEGVMGPDEFHEKLPDAPENVFGVKDNAYTNVMASWLLEECISMIEKLDKDVFKSLCEKLKFSMDETKKWKEISKKLNVNISPDGIIEQFDGYFKLQDLDMEAYRKKYGDIHRMDRILKAENDSPDNYKIGKQADTLMMFYLLEPDRVAKILEHMGYKVDNIIQMLEKNYDYYEKRCSHGSTLSRVVHAVIASYIGRKEEAWKMFMDAMVSDIHDTQGGTTIEGIHCGVMAGTIDIVTRRYCGIDFDDKSIHVNPNIPEHWNYVKFKVLHRGKTYNFEFERDNNTTEVTITLQAMEKAVIQINGENVELIPYNPTTFTL